MRVAYLGLGLALAGCAHHRATRTPELTASSTMPKRLVSECVMRELSSLPVAVVRTQGGTKDSVSVRFDQAVATEIEVSQLGSGTVTAVFADRGRWLYSDQVSVAVQRCSERP
jgi:hypothetical protein